MRNRSDGTHGLGLFSILMILTIVGDKLNTRFICYTAHTNIVFSASISNIECRFCLRKNCKEFSAVVTFSRTGIVGDYVAFQHSISKVISHKTWKDVTGYSVYAHQLKTDLKLYCKLFYEAKLYKKDNEIFIFKWIEFKNEY